MTELERIGGEESLRAIIDAFVDHMFDDVMIGFFFRKVSRKHIKELEFQHAAEHLGGPIVYRGRPLAEAHAPHRIMSGQFSRRKQILKETLEAHGVPEDVRERWLERTEQLRALITGGRPC
jgi:hemoglobin